MHLASGVEVAATVVDHKIPHRGDSKLFWDRSNWQPLCADHHNGVKQRQDNRGYLPGVDSVGRPLAPDHPWNRTDATRR